MAISALKHDGQLWISLGDHRKSTSWKTKQLSWSALLNRFSETRRTSETHKEYLKMTKDQQSEKKDVGGFVGGIINGGRRLGKAITSRTIVTLDIDYTTTDFWGTYELLFDNAAALYSTHKHSGDTPRLRLIMPLDREYLPDQYEAIARKVADLLNIEIFDDTTFQRERLMYWPSTSKDGEFLFKYQDGPFLNGLEILSRYHNWKDTSQWPVSSRVSDHVRVSADKQGDPLEKPGVIGAFCRAYTLTETLDLFLTEAYVPTDQENRYTYVHGSTAAGLIVYDDKFAYSHHGTDPISGKLCNAFDLVRLHRFGYLDEGTDPETPVQKRPSYSTMCEWAVKDKGVTRELDVNRLEVMRQIFGEEMGEVDIEWMSKLQKTKSGENSCSIENVRLIVLNDPHLRTSFYYDGFRNRDTICGPLPWRKDTIDGQPMTDADDTGLRWYLETVYGITGEQRVRDGFRQAMFKLTHHPIRVYLKSLMWDQEKRLDTLLIDYFGSDDNEYVRAVTRKTFVAAVARVFQPGIDYDTMLVLVGPQGIGKSKFWKRISEPWFSDSFPPLDNIGKAMEQLQGAWVIEIGELAGFKKSDMETVKAFLSKTEDRYRPAYGRRTEEYPRQCIFIGTTNEDDFLKDATGDRRFWPVRVPGVGIKNVFRHLRGIEIKQIWAEAYAAYMESETIHLSPELEKIGSVLKKEYTEEDHREGEIREFLERELPVRWHIMNTYERQAWLKTGENAFGADEEKMKLDKICPIEIWTDVLGNREQDATYFKLKQIRDIVNKIEGWRSQRIKTRRHGQQRGFRRVTKGGDKKVRDDKDFDDDFEI